MYVRVTRPEEGIGRIQLHRPEVLNALNLQLMEELVSALVSMDRDEGIRCILIGRSPLATIKPTGKRCG